MDEGTFWIIVMLAPFGVGIALMFAQIAVATHDVARQHREGVPGTGWPLVAMGAALAVFLGLLIVGRFTGTERGGTPWVPPADRPAVSIPVAAPVVEVGP